MTMIKFHTKTNIITTLPYSKNVIILKNALKMLKNE